MITGTLAELLRTLPAPFAVVDLVNGRPAFAIKPDPADLPGMTAPAVVIAFTPILYRTDHGAVFQLLATFFDDPDHPMEMDAFLNPAQPRDLNVLRALVVQPTLDFHIFGPDMEHVSKSINVSGRTRLELDGMIGIARQHNRSLRPGRYNYAAALAEVKEAGE